MKRLVFLIPLVILVLAAGCSGKDTKTEGTTHVPTTQVVSETTEAATDQLFITVTAPADKSTVNAATVTVTGKTLPVAILSVNGQLLKVGADGTFSTPVSLEIGVNVIQIVASDISGTEIGKVITVGRTQ